jgi:hypothetical protein
MEAIRTPCKNCVFAEYEKLTQTGCKMKQLDIYQAQGKVVEVYDNDLEFYLIDGACCPYLRGPDWLSTLKPGSDLKEAVIEECKTQYHAIIIANDDLEDIRTTVENIATQTIKPKHITVVKKTETNIRPRRIVDILKPINIPWRLENVTDPSFDDTQSVEMVLTVFKFPFYLLIRAGDTIPVDTVSIIDSKIKNELLQFGMIEPSETKKFTFVAGLVHEYLGGNKDVNLRDKIARFFQEEGVLSADTLWNNQQLQLSQ